MGRPIEPQASIASMNPPSFEELSGTPIFVPPPPVVIPDLDDDKPAASLPPQAGTPPRAPDPMALAYASGAEPLPYSPLPGKATSGETLVPAPSPLYNTAASFPPPGPPPLYEKPIEPPQHPASGTLVPSTDAHVGEAFGVGAVVPNAEVAAQVEFEPGPEVQAYDPEHAPVPPRRPDAAAAAPENKDIKPQFTPFQNTGTLNQARDGALVSVADSDTARFFDANLAAATAVGFGTDEPAPARSAAPANAVLAGGVTLMIVGAAALALIVVIIMLMFAMNSGSPQSSVITPALPPTASANTVQSPPPVPASAPNVAPVEEVVETPEVAPAVPAAAAPVAAKSTSTRPASGTAAPKPAETAAKADKPADSPWGATDGKASSSTAPAPAATTEEKKKGGLFKKDK